jgi:hypothetical protein
MQSLLPDTTLHTSSQEIFTAIRDLHIHMRMSLLCTVPSLLLSYIHSYTQVKKKRRIPPMRKTFFPDNRPVTFDLEVHPVDAIVVGESEAKLLAFVVGMPVMMQDTGQIEAGRSHEMLQQSRIMTMLFTMKGELLVVFMLTVGLCLLYSCSQWVCACSYTRMFCGARAGGS